VSSVRPTGKCLHCGKLYFGEGTAMDFHYEHIDDCPGKGKSVGQVIEENLPEVLTILSRKPRKRNKKC